MTLPKATKTQNGIHQNWGNNYECYDYKYQYNDINNIRKKKNKKKTRLL
jgi:hypothetical protein